MTYLELLDALAQDNINNRGGQETLNARLQKFFTGSTPRQEIVPAPQKPVDPDPYQMPTEPGTEEMEERGNWFWYGGEWNPNLQYLEPDADPVTSYEADRRNSLLRYNKILATQGKEAADLYMNEWQSSHPTQNPLTDTTPIQTKARILKPSLESLEGLLMSKRAPEKPIVSERQIAPVAQGPVQTKQEVAQAPGKMTPNVGSPREAIESSADQQREIMKQRTSGQKF